MRSRLARPGALVGALIICAAAIVIMSQGTHQATTNANPLNSAGASPIAETVESPSSSSSSSPERLPLSAAPEILVRVRSAVGRSLKAVRADISSTHVLQPASQELEVRLLKDGDPAIAVPAATPPACGIATIAEGHVRKRLSMGELLRQGDFPVVLLDPDISATLDGTIEDESGALLAGVEITAVSVADKTRCTSTSEQSGHFQLIGVPTNASLHLICATPSSGEYIFVAPAVAPGTQRNGIRLVIPATRMLNLIVKDAATEKPVAGANVEYEPALDGDAIGGLLCAPLDDNQSTDTDGKVLMRVLRKSAHLRVTAREYQVGRAEVSQSGESQEIFLHRWQRLNVELQADNGTLNYGGLKVRRPGKIIVQTVPHVDEYMRFLLDSPNAESPTVECIDAEAKCSQYPSSWVLSVDRTPPFTLFLKCGSEVIAREVVRDTQSGQTIYLRVNATQFRSRSGLQLRLVDTRGAPWLGSFGLSLIDSSAFERSGRTVGFVAITGPDGRFALENLSPGLKRVEIEARIADRTIRLFLENVDLRAHEVNDIGDIVVPEPGRIAVSPAVEDGAIVPLSVAVYSYEYNDYPSIGGAVSTPNRLVWSSSSWEIEGLRPGVYRVEISGNGYIMAATEVTVVAGSSAEFAPILRRGYPVDFVFDREKPRTAAWLEVVNESGDLLLRAHVPSEEVALRAFLPLGDAMIRVLDRKETLLKEVRKTISTNITQIGIGLGEK